MIKQKGHAHINTYMLVCLRLFILGITYKNLCHTNLLHCNRLEKGKIHLLKLAYKLLFSNHHSLEMSMWINCVTVTVKFAFVSENLWKWTQRFPWSKKLSNNLDNDIQMRIYIFDIQLNRFAISKGPRLQFSEHCNLRRTNEPVKTRL